MRGVYAERATGQAIAQLQSKQDNLPLIATQTFMSKIHNRKIEVVKFSKFLKDKISEGTLQIPQALPLTIFHGSTIEMLVATQTRDIWDQTSENHTA